jgi:hypothetical protein
MNAEAPGQRLLFENDRIRIWERSSRLGPVHVFTGIPISSFQSSSTGGR